MYAPEKKRRKKDTKSFYKELQQQANGKAEQKFNRKAVIQQLV